MIDDPGLLVSADSLKGMAHPLRLALLSALEARGRATASLLAADLGESSGATSYHLRQLHRHGFVVDADQQGTGRERWWQPVPGGWTMSAELLTAPGTRAAADLVLKAILSRSARRATEFVAARGQWAAEWQDAAQRVEWHLDLNAEQLSALNREVIAVLTRYRAAVPGPGARRVQVEHAAFPLGRPDDPVAIGQDR